MMLWREYDHPPAFDLAWRIIRLRIAHTFGWSLDVVDALSPHTIAEIIGYLIGM